MLLKMALEGEGRLVPIGTTGYVVRTRESHSMGYHREHGLVLVADVQVLPESVSADLISWSHGYVYSCEFIEDRPSLEGWADSPGDSVLHAPPHGGSYALYASYGGRSIPTDVKRFLTAQGYAWQARHGSCRASKWVKGSGSLLVYADRELFPCMTLERAWTRTTDEGSTAPLRKCLDADRRAVDSFDLILRTLWGA